MLVKHIRHDDEDHDDGRTAHSIADLDALYELVRSIETQLPEDHRTMIEITTSKAGGTPILELTEVDWVVEVEQTVLGGLTAAKKREIDQLDALVSRLYEQYGKVNITIEQRLNVLAQVRKIVELRARLTGALPTEGR